MPVDIWALGVTAYILSYNKFPFYSENNDLFELYDKIHKAEFEIPSKPKRSKYFINFLKRCLEKDPNKRITSEKIFYLKWLDIGQKENLKKELASIQKENEQLKVNIEKQMSFNAIEQEAKEKLGMQKLDNNQKVYVNLNKSDYIEPSESVSNTENQKEETWWCKLLKDLFKIDN